jgi:nicotinate phosphoribosyltransferase
LYDERGKATADLIGLYDEEPEKVDQIMLRHPIDSSRFRTLHRDSITKIEPLHEQYLDRGTLVAELPSIERLRERRREDVRSLDTGVRRLINPHIYHVSLTQQLWTLKQELIASAEQQTR